MKRFLAPILLLTLLLPSLAQGQVLKDWVGKGMGLLCETTGVGCVDFKDLVERNGVYFKKFSDVPFTGKTTGKDRGSFKTGKQDGLWVGYWENGQLYYKGTYKDGKRDGPWVAYWEGGGLHPWTGTYKDGVKVK